jgi:Glycosyltransferase Family 4/Glycosyl transferases group 1
MGGGQWQALRLMEGQRQAGHEVALLAPSDSELFHQASEQDLAVSSLSARELYRARPDVMHAHDARSHTLAAILSRAPLIVSRRVAFPIKKGLASRWKYQRASHYIAVSDFVKRHLVTFGIPERDVTVIYDAVPLLPAAGGDRIIAPANKAGALLEEAGRLAGISIEPTADLGATLPYARLFVYVTDCEGLGSAILLAMSASVPVAASATGGIPEIIEHERTGLLFSNTPEQIANAMRRLLNDEALAAACAACARRKVEERFTVPVMVTRTLHVYDQVLKCQKPSSHCSSAS